MEIYFTGEEAAQLVGAAEFILRTVGNAQGRAEAYKARRDTWGETNETSPFPRTLAGIVRIRAQEGGEVKNTEEGKQSEAGPTGEASFLFSDEEMKRMPKLKDGHLRKTKEGLYQIRYRREGYDKQFTSKSLQTVKELFREWVQSVSDGKKTLLPKKSQNFLDFSERYFANVKRVNVEEGTYQTQHRCAELHIYPALGGLPIRRITPIKCQEVLNAILAEGKGRTAETAKFILGEVFRAAMGEKLIASNPMEYVKIPRHIRENGKALSRDSVLAFIEACVRSPYQKQYMIYLYTGIRRNELHSLRIEGDFISVVCGKCRKGQKKRRRKIPIAPALRPFLPLSDDELAVENDVLTGNFKKLCPQHNLNDLRHTFVSKAQECGIPKELVDLWTDHVDKKDMTAGVYTHFSEEFQIEEMKKLFF